MPEVPPTPALILDGVQQSYIVIDRTPFTVGRLPGSMLLLHHPFISRRHAEIVYEEDRFVLLDCNSRHGTFVNGERVERHLLADNDVLHFGTLAGPELRFGVPSLEPTISVRDLLGNLQPESPDNSAIEKLNWLLEAARKLNHHGGVEQVLSALIEATLALTRVERGFVLLCNSESESPTLAAGLNSSGQPLVDDSTISHSAIREALHSADPYIVTDTLSAANGSPTESVMAQNIRAILCIPLRSRRNPGKVLGLLYLDSRLRSGSLTRIDNELLQTIATEAAALVENAQLTVEEEHARRYREELKIAAEIQRSLISTKLPHVPFAAIATRFDPCREIAGDFYDVVANKNELCVVVADVAGKGVSAALLAHTLQGMVYAQLVARLSLKEIARALNSYTFTKDVGKYATIVVIKLHSNGFMEYINCGHVHPLVNRNGKVERLNASNLPIGLIEDGTFLAYNMQLKPGTRVLVVTDGVTEAENAELDYYGAARLEAAFSASKDLNDVVADFDRFRDNEPANDDRTMVEIRYR